MSDNDSNLTQTDIEAIAVQVKDAAGATNTDLGKFIRKNLLYLFLGLAGLGGSGGVAWAKFGPDAVQQNVRDIKRNSMKIESLGVEAVNTQEQIVEVTKYQEQNTAAIMDAIETGKAKPVAKPKKLQDLEEQVSERAKKAKAGKLLEVSDEEVDAAIEKEGKGE